MSENWRKTLYLLTIIFITTVLVALPLFSVSAQKKVKITIWVPPWWNPVSAWSGREMIKQFNATNPKIDLVPEALAGVAGQRLMEVQKLMIAVSAGTPPDIAIIDRFMAASWAARGMLIPLDDLIKRDNFPMTDYYDAVREECMMGGKYYVVPNGTDDRALYWNKDIFKEAGFDPEKPPKTWYEAYEYATKLSKYDARGKLTRIGFVPTMSSLGTYVDNSWLYLYGWQNGGEFMSPDGKKCTLNDPYIVEALEWMVKVSDALGGAEKIAAYTQTFLTDAQDPFILGQIAMYVTGNWMLGTYSRFKPDLNFDVAPAPVPDDRYFQRGRFKGKPQFITWSGGWSWGIPKGVKKVDEAWEAVKWLCTTPGFEAMYKGDYEYNKSLGRPFVPGMSSNRVADGVLLAKYSPLLTEKYAKYAEANKLFFDLMEVSRFRPVTAVATELWDWHVRAVEMASYHKMTPKEALDYAASKVQERIDELIRQGLIK